MIVLASAAQDTLPYHHILSLHNASYCSFPWRRNNEAL